MRVLQALILLLLSVSVAHADPCANYSKWSSIVTSDEKVEVKIWYRPQNGIKASHVYVWYIYRDGRGEEGGCIRLRSGGYSPRTYEWLMSGDKGLRDQARHLIEIWGATQGVLRHADPLGD